MILYYIFLIVLFGLVLILLKSCLFLCFLILQGKTLAFVLPILESLTNGALKVSRKTGYGRAPSVLVLLPTRELATQVLCKNPF